MSSQDVKIKNYISQYGWICVFLISALEFTIDYSKFHFIDKRVFFVIPTCICIYELIKCRAHILKKSMCSLFILCLLVLFCSRDFGYILLGFSIVVLSLMEVGDRQFETIRKLCIVIGMITAIGCIIQAINPGFFYSIGSIFLNSSWLAQTKRFAAWGMYAGFTYQTGTSANLIVFAIISLLSKPADNAKLNKILILVVLYIGLILTAKRMLLLIALVLPLICSLCNTKAENKNIANKLIALVAVLVVLIIAFSALLPNLSSITVVKRLFYNDSDLGYSSNRVDYYRMAWNLFKGSPVLGIGWGKFAAITEIGTSVHNVFIQLLCETGMIGFTIFIIAAGHAFFSIFKKAKEIYVYEEQERCMIVFSLMIQVYFLLYCFSGNPLYNISSRTIYFFACIIGYSMVFIEQKQNALYE